MSPRVDGPRGCRPEELPQVVELIDAIFRSGSDQRIATDYPLVFTPRHAARSRVLAVDGRIVAHVPAAPRIAAAGPDRFGVAMIAPTATHPDHRRRGYATRCLRDAHRVIAGEGCVAAALWTERETFPFYRHSGWEAVASQGEAFVLTAADRDRFRPASFAVRTQGDDEQGMAELLALHGAEPWRLERDEQQARALFRLPKITVFRAEDAGAGRLRAYLVLGAGTNKPGIIEATGDPVAVEHLLHHVLGSRAGGEPAQVVPPPARPDGIPSTLSAVIAGRGAGRRITLEEAAGVGLQMMRLFSLTRFLQAIYGYLRQAAVSGVEGALTLGCREDGQAVRVRLAGGGASVEQAAPAAAQMLGRRQLVQVLFGHHPGDEPPPLVDDTGLAAALFPYRLPLWELDHC
ncbi:MAG: GNAT family N-acetyltransferase [Spirochaetaceae bacterium]|nr:GNAT family N-acetyltransferase [Spirochaetaceae bacterium]